MLYQNDKELFRLLREKLYTSVVGDIMDRMGRLHQFLPPQVRPLRDDMIIAGRAMPVLEADVTGFVTENGNNRLMEKNFGLMLEALDAIGEDEVYLCPDSSLRYALIGEIMCTRMNIRKAAGAVVNGYHRDTRGILALDMPVFSRGPYAQDQGPRGKVLDYRVPIEAGGVRIEPGDIVFGDYDGVVIIPRSIEAEVVEQAYEKATGENFVADRIRVGLSAVESWNRYKIM